MYHNYYVASNLLGYEIKTLLIVTKNRKQIRAYGGCLGSQRRRRTW